MSSPPRQVHIPVLRPRYPYASLSSGWVCRHLHLSSSHMPCFSCTRNPRACPGQTPCSLHQLLKMHDWEARTLGRADVIEVKVTKSVMRCREKASQADSLVWTLVPSFIFSYLQYSRHRAGRYDKKLWMTHAPKERQLEPRQNTLGLWHVTRYLN